MKFPDLRMHGPLFVVPGQRQRYELELLGEPMDLASVELFVQTMHGWNVRGHRMRGRFPRADQIVRRTIGHASYVPNNETRFAVDVEIPADTPTSHVLLDGLAFACIGIDVVLWRRGRMFQHHFPLHVRQPLGEMAPLTAVAGSSAPGVKLELSIANARATGGMTLVGACSAIDTHGDIAISLALRCSLATSDFQSDHVIKETKLKIPRHAGASPVPFTFELPRYVAPSITTSTHRISYALQAGIGWFAKTFTETPLEIVDARPAPAVVRAPAIGVPRVEPLFTEVATRLGWSLGPSVHAHPVLGTIMPWMNKIDGDHELRVGHAFRDDGSTFLIAQLSYRSLELGFAVAPIGRLQPRSDLSFRDPTSDREYQAAATDAPRAKGLIAAIVPELASLGRIVSWNDDGLTCERAITEITAELVAAMAIALRTVSRAIARTQREGLDAGPYR